MYLCNLKLTGKDLPAQLPERVTNEVSSMVDIISFGVADAQSASQPASNAPSFPDVPTIQAPQPQPSSSQLLSQLNPQPTGFQPQPTGFQYQQTGFQSSMPTGLQPQATGFPVLPCLPCPQASVKVCHLNLLAFPWLLSTLSLLAVLANGVLSTPQLPVFPTYKLFNRK